MENLGEANHSGEKQDSLTAEWAAFENLLGNSAFTSGQSASLAPPSASTMQTTIVDWSSSSGDSSADEESRPGVAEAGRVKKDTSDSSSSGDEGAGKAVGSQTTDSCQQRLLALSKQSDVASCDISEHKSHAQEKDKDMGTADDKCSASTRGHRRTRSRSASPSHKNTALQRQPSNDASKSTDRDKCRSRDSHGRKRKDSDDKRSKSRGRSQSHGKTTHSRGKRSRSRGRRSKSRSRRSRSRGRKSRSHGKRSRSRERRSRSRGKTDRSHRRRSRDRRSRSRSHGHSGKSSRHRRSRSRGKRSRSGSEARDSKPSVKGGLLTLEEIRNERKRNKRRKQPLGLGRNKMMRSRSRSYSPVRRRHSPRDSAPKKLTFKEHLRQQLLNVGKDTDVGALLDGDDSNVAGSSENPSNLPLNSVNPLAAMARLGGEKGKVTPQQALMQTMALMHQKAQELTGVAVPKYYNPAAVNPLKYAEQMQKRKLLWSHAKQDHEEEGVATWGGSAFSQDDDGKIATKFRKLMGMKKDAEELAASGELNTEQMARQEELFAQLDKEYAFARMTTHTHRGIGLGFQSLGMPDT